MAVKKSSNKSARGKTRIDDSVTERKLIEEALKESEQKYRFLVDNSEEFIFVISKTGRVVFANKKALATIGYTQKEVIGKSIVSFLTKDSIKKSLYALSQEFLGHPQPEFDVGVRTKSGEIRVLEISLGSAFVHEKGKLVGILISAHDVTERKKAEEALRESEEKYRKQFDEALDAIFIADAKTGILVDCNRAACELVERKKSELVGKHQRILHPPSDTKGKFSRTFKQHLKEKEVQALEARIITKKGKIKQVAIKASIFELKGKEFLQGIFRDITEQKKVEQAILRTNMFNSALVENAPFGIMTVKKDGSVDYVNPIMLEIAGANSNYFKDMNVFKLPAYINLGLSEKIRKCFKGKPFFMGPVEYISHFSKKKTVRNFTGMPMRDEAEKVEKVMLFIEDLTQIKEAEEKVRENEERFRTIFEGATDGILVADSKTKKFVFVNPKICELTGYPSKELLKLGITDIHPKKNLSYVLSQITEQLQGKETLARNLPVLRKDKKIIYCDINATPIKIKSQEFLVGFFRDITERKKAEEELSKKSQDLERFNRMAVGRELKMVELKKRIRELEEKLRSK